MSRRVYSTPGEAVRQEAAGRSSLAAIGDQPSARVAGRAESRSLMRQRRRRQVEQERRQQDDDEDRDQTDRGAAGGVSHRYRTAPQRRQREKVRPNDVST